MLNALSIDVEEYFQVEALAPVIPQKFWDQLEPRLPKILPRILETLAAMEVRATFFWVGWAAKRYPELVKETVSYGHEIASHGWSHTSLFRLSPQEFRREIRQSKSLLEDLSGREVLGYRAPTYSITPKTIWGLEILAEEGFRYDSSIFPVRHDLYGFPRAPRFPFRFKDEAPSSFPVFTGSPIEFGVDHLPFRSLLVM